MVIPKMPPGMKPLCLFCHGEPVFGGTFEPNEALRKELGIPDGKTRVGFHFLCAKCFQSADVFQKVEEHHIRELRKLAAKENNEVGK